MVTRDNQNEPKKTLTPQDVAELLQLEERTVRRMYNEGLIKGSRVGRSPRGPLRFTQEDVEAYLESTRGR